MIDLIGMTLEVLSGVSGVLRRLGFNQWTDATERGTTVPGHPKTRCRRNQPDMRDAKARAVGIERALGSFQGRVVLLDMEVSSHREEWDTDSPS